MGWLENVGKFGLWDAKQHLRSLRRDGGLRYARDRIFRNEDVMRQYEAETGRDSKHPKQARDAARALLAIFGAYNALGGAGAGATEAEYLAAADAAGGLSPQFGSHAAYKAGISGAAPVNGWMRWGRGLQMAGDALQYAPTVDMPEAEEVEYYTLSPDPYFAYSSRGLKRRSMSDAPIARGLRGENPIDDNGVQIALIQELTKRIQRLEARVAARRRSRNG